MAELSAYNQPNAVVNDTYQGSTIIEVLDGPAGRYRWRPSTPPSSTNLSYTASPTGGIVVSDTGNDATIPLADNTNAGLMQPGVVHPNSPAATFPATALREGQLFVRTGPTAPGLYVAVDTVGNWRGPL